MYIFVPMKLVFATHNKYKLREVQTLLPNNIQLKSLTDINCVDEIPETANTLEGNARLKANYISEHIGFDCFADDTGLEVEVLQGEPGVYSARYAGVENSAEANMHLLLEKLKGISNRNAQFRTVIVLNLQGNQYQFEGVCKGEILEERQGKGGFGYDPIFKPEGFDKSFAEMTLAEKGDISHRGKAVAKLVAFLRGMVKKKSFHINFTLNGRSFKNVEELLTFSKTISEEVFSFLTNWFDATDVIKVLTSGSTGAPTSIVLRKKYMIASAIATGNYFDIQQKTKALLCLSPIYIAGKMMLVRALILGWNLEVVAPSGYPLEVTNNSFDFCAMVPLQLYNSISQLQKVKKVIVGGGVVSDDLLKRIQGISTDIFATYGMTETVTHIAVRRLNNFQDDGSKKQSFENVYTVLPTAKISIDDRGCLVIDAPEISDTKIITNDLVSVIAENQFKWLGRFDNIINSGGIKLIPEQIEEKLSPIIKYRFFVVGMPDKLLGEKLVLIVEDTDLKLKITKLRVEIAALTSLTKYEKPKEIYRVSHFVETETKKIQRHKTLDLIL